jgi:hypothetical protein
VIIAYQGLCSVVGEVSSGPVLLESLMARYLNDKSKKSNNHHLEVLPVKAFGMLCVFVHSKFSYGYIIQMHEISQNCCRTTV